MLQNLQKLSIELSQKFIQIKISSSLTVFSCKVCPKVAWIQQGKLMVI